MALKGFFISFEGGEGSGKSTQVRRLREELEKTGRSVLITREPGGTPEAEKIRNLLVNRDGGNWSSMAECLLLYAARQMHVETLIRPALAQGLIVISDRFADSTVAYQGYGHGLDLEAIQNLNNLVLKSFQPNLTIILDLPIDTGLHRAGRRIQAAQSKEDRFERLDQQFHERMRHGYLEIARKNPQRCHVVDATESVEAIAVSV